MAIRSLFACLFIAGQLTAGVVFEITSKEGKQESFTTEVLVEGKNLKMNIAEGRNAKSGEMIYQGEKRQMVTVDHKRKSYLTMDQATIKKLSGKMNDAMSQMQKALESVPESQRAMMEKMMKDRMPAAAKALPEVTVKKMGQKKTVNGYPCVRYDMFEDGTKIREFWVTPWNKVDGGNEVADAFKDMSAFFEDMIAAFSSMSAMKGSFAQDNMFRQMEKLGGFPIKTIDYAADGSMERESELRSTKRQKLDPSDFEPPSGYKRQRMDF